jgi:hypothetical protein
MEVLSMRIKCISLVTMLLWAIIIIMMVPQIPITSSEDVMEVHELTLYLYGDEPPIEDAYFSTEAPTGPPNSTDFPSSGGTIVVYELGRWNTQPLNKPLAINGTFSVSLWLENGQSLPATVELECQLLVNEMDTGITFSSEEMFLSDSLLEVNFSDHVNLNMKIHDRFGILIRAQYQGTGFSFFWAGADYDSRISAHANWLDIGIPHPEVHEGANTATIEAHLLHVFGPDEIADYSMEITGPTTAMSITGPTIEVEGEKEIATWVWNYGADGGYEGSEYTIRISVVDIYGNYWNGSLEFYLTESPISEDPTSWYLFDRTISSNGEDMMPSMIIDDEGRFWIAYASNRDFSWVDIYIESSPDGRTWTLEARITEDTAYDVHPCLIQDQAGVYWLVWQSDVGGDYQILISSSTDGSNWEVPIQALNQPDQNMEPSLIQDDSGTYWMAWRNLNAQNQDNIFVASSQTALIWSAPTQVSIAGSELSPSLIQEEEGGYRVVWFSGSSGNDELWQAVSADGQAWLGNPITNDGRDYIYPCLIQNSTGGYDITYVSDRSERPKIYHLSSPDGTNWIDEYQVENYTTYQVTSLIQDENGTMWMAFPYQIPDSWNIWVLSRNMSNSLPDADINDIPDESSGDIFVEYILRDLEGDDVNITVEYSMNGQSFYPASMGAGGDGATLLSSSREGTSHIFVWDSTTDFFGIDLDRVYLKITASDQYHPGYADTSNPFSLDNNKAPIAEIETPSSEQSGSVTINFTLFDEEYDQIDVVPMYSLNGIDYISPTLSSGSQSIHNLASSPEGIVHSLIWDTDSDLPFGDVETVYFSVHPFDPQNGTKAQAGPFHIDNNEPPSVSVVNLHGVQSASVPIEYTLTDSESDDLRIEVYYSTDGTAFKSAPRGSGGDPISGLSSSTTGMEHEFVWNSKSGLDDRDEDKVYIKIIAFDRDRGGESQTSSFHLDNKAPSFDPDPEVGDVADSEATISWSSDEPASYSLYYGTGNFDSEITENTPGTSRSINLEDLVPGAEYSFYVELYDGEGNGPTRSSTISFTTLLSNNPPEALFVSPSQNEEVSGEITISGTTSDDNRVEVLEIRVDSGDWESIYVSEFWTYDLETRDLENGELTLFVRAFDGELYSDVDSITILVNNEEDEVPGNNDPDPKETEENEIYILLLIPIIVIIVVIAIAMILVARKKGKNNP